MRRYLPPSALVVISFLVAELLPGSAPLDQPLLWPFLLLIYGSGALLIREFVRRRRRGWASILVLGVAYGLIEEGLALQSLFNPALYNAAEWGGRVWGINGVYAEAAITIHAVWSAAIPILLTDLLFPKLRSVPYLGRIGLALTVVWYALGVGLLSAIRMTSIAPGFQTPPATLVLTALLAALLTVVGLFVLPVQTEQTNNRTAPRPRVVFLTTCCAALVWHFLLALLWRVVPAAAGWPYVFLPMAAALLLATGLLWQVEQWTGAANWNDLHRLAIAGGAIISHSLIGGLIFPNTAVDRVGILLLAIATLVGLGVLAHHVRARVANAVLAERSRV